VLSRLVDSASRVVLSYPGHDKDRELRPSPLLEQVTVSENGLDDAELSGTFYGTLPGTAPFEIFQEQYAPDIDRDRPASGGSSLFRDQALCPFRAFAHHRLHADTIDTTDIGLNAMQRGSLVHRVLQLVWDRLKNSKALKNTSDAVLEDYITRAVNDAIQQLAGIRSDTFSDRFRRLEQQRLVRMVRDWLLIDLERPAFTVTATEKGHHVLFAGITLNLRLDRIDQLADGRLVIIDYKTGNVSLRDWEGDRPAEPQLPLYAITSEGEVAALVYASLKTGDMQYIGLAQEDVSMPGKVYPDASWESRLEHWKTVLADLGGEFLGGLAAVAPENDKACQYCDQHPFCRIHEKAQTLMVDESDE
ncbi:MAG: PD-(D/E)XK nuclease family protein, partial [Gammaproteobacteria bacterium]|nr:PD-(D/E)XK nuclease family protein [Gammaproteobacteria bacterium]